MRWVIIGLCLAAAVVFAVSRLMPAKPDADSAAADPSVSVKSAEDAKVDDLLASMTLEEKVGQLFLARVPEEDATSDIETWHLGGYMMFFRDFKGETPRTITKKIAEYQDHATVPMFIGVDEEGGTVSRLKYGDGLISEDFESPQELYNDGGLDAVREDARTKSKLLKSYGINYNLAPDADVSTDPNSFIYERTYGQGADATADYVTTVVGAMQENKVGNCLKHFPGYGDNGDSHEEIIRDSRTLASFEATDLVPFKAGIDAGADSVLVTHNIIECMDASLPASLSKPVHDYLRNTLHFDGVIVTDDFDMKGLSDFVDQDTGAVETIAAGSDLVISSSYATQIPAVVAAVNNQTLSQDQIDGAARCVLKMKMRLGLIK